MKSFVSITLEELSSHSTCQSLWVAYEGKGGEEFLLQFGGMQLDHVFMDDSIHSHSQTALDILKKYQIGTMAGFKVNLADNNSPKAFIDFEKPMVYQCFTAKWTKEQYLREIHIPRHSKEIAPMFASPFLEPFSRTPWYYVPIVWIPFAFYLFTLGIDKSSNHLAFSSFVWLVGVFIWTLLEYTLHRFVFHLERFLPDNQIAFTAHFLVHGIHHYLPMDRMRLVMPPVMTIIVSTPIYLLYRLLFSYEYATILLSGGFSGYVVYDLMHYYLHHGRPLSSHVRSMKAYHLDHHYKNANLGFGISSKFWDVVFGTLLTANDLKKD